MTRPTNNSPHPPPVSEAALWASRLGRARRFAALATPHPLNPTTAQSTERTSDMESSTGASGVHGLVLDEARELCRRQDEQLKSQKTLSRGIPAAILASGAIVLAAAHNLEDAFAEAIYFLAIAMAVFAVIVEVIALRWKAGPDIGELAGAIEDDDTAVTALQTRLITALGDQYTHNKTTLGFVRFFVAVQAVTALLCAALLFAELAQAS